MIRIASRHANELCLRASTIMRRVAGPLTCVIVTLGLAGTQSVMADCDSRGYEIPKRAHESAATIAQRSFMRNQLGIMYARGRGAPKNSRLASELFRQLAMDGYTPAMVNLGTLYERGIAGRRNHRQAYAWIRAALALGVPKEDYEATLFKLGMISARLGAAQTASAERLALTIIERVGGRCGGSGDPCEGIMAQRLAP